MAGSWAWALSITPSHLRVSRCLHHPPRALRKPEGVPGLHPPESFAVQRAACAARCIRGCCPHLQPQTLALRRQTVSSPRVTSTDTGTHSAPAVLVFWSWEAQFPHGKGMVSP